MSNWRHANETENGLKPKQPASFSEWARTRGEKITAPVARALARLGLTPNIATLLGLALNFGVAVVLALGYTTWGGWLLLLAGAFDALDGALARQMNSKTRFGGFLDSTCDRYAEAAILLGLMIPFLRAGAQGQVQVILIFVTLVGSILISYTRARAEGLGLECKVGLLTRLERFLIMAAALILNQVTLALWFLAVLTHFTALQRIAHVWRITRENDQM
jgi:CDP-diacylglycerol--glycerol-3-phosphate 3-phosphatidyltransferase